MQYKLYLPIHRSELKPVPWWIWLLPSKICTHLLYKGVDPNVEYIIIGD